MFIMKNEFVALQYFQVFKFLKKIAMEVTKPLDIEAEQLFSLGRQIDSAYIVDVLMFEASITFLEFIIIK